MDGPWHRTFSGGDREHSAPAWRKRHQRSGPDQETSSADFPSRRRAGFRIDRPDRNHSRLGE